MRVHIWLGLVCSGTMAAVLWSGGAALASGPSEATLVQGKQVYEQLCNGCHGDTGKGDTFKSWVLSIEPRDLTLGSYKLRSTPQGTLPTDEDLHRTIRYGILRSAMPQYRRLSDEEIEAVVAYIKTFSARWETEEPGTPIAIPDLPADLMSRGSVARGKEVYGLLQCFSCHGADGSGRAESAGGKAQGEVARSANLRRGIYKSGDTERGLYRAIVTGLDGSAMHSFASLFTKAEGKKTGPADAWHLVAYVLSLRKTQ